MTVLRSIKRGKNKKEEIGFFLYFLIHQLLEVKWSTGIVKVQSAQKSVSAMGLNIPQEQIATL